MSLLSSSSAVIGLWPDGITVSRRGRSGEEASTQTYSANNTSGGNSASWRTSIAVLEEWLDDNEGTRAKSDIVISDQFMRYMVLPWSPELANDDEWRALARAKIDLMWGNGDDFDIRLDQRRYKRSRLVCAMELDFRTRLKTLMSDHDHAIRTIQPHFTFAFNDVAAGISAHDALMVVSERDCATVAAITGCCWGHIRTILLPGLDSNAVDTLVNRERLLLGLSSEAAVIGGRYYPTLSAVAAI
ncbi:MAG: hypothetical protein ABSD02_15525 [Steroidobacteraceae bacterium]